MVDRKREKEFVIAHAHTIAWIKIIPGLAERGAQKHFFRQYSRIMGADW
jgi:hypothetical protein